jgi:hypothetical protein
MKRRAPPSWQPVKRPRVPPPTLKRSLPAQIFNPKRARYVEPAQPVQPVQSVQPVQQQTPHPLFVELIQYVNRLEQRIAALESGHHPAEPSFQPGIVVF